MFQIPPGMMAPDNTIDGLITAVFGDIQANYNQPGYLSGRAILSPKNVDVDALNNKVLEMIPGEVGSFHSKSQLIPFRVPEMYKTNFDELNNSANTGVDSTGVDR